MRYMASRLRPASWLRPSSRIARRRRAVLREGDLIIGLDGHNVSSIDQLHRFLTDQRIGQETTLTVIRGADKLEIAITPAESPSRSG